MQTCCIKEINSSYMDHIEHITILFFSLYYYFSFSFWYSRKMTGSELLCLPKAKSSRFYLWSFSLTLPPSFFFSILKKIAKKIGQNSFSNSWKKSSKRPQLIMFSGCYTSNHTIVFRVFSLFIITNIFQFHGPKWGLSAGAHLFFIFVL